MDDENEYGIFACLSPICSDISDPKPQEMRAAAGVQPQEQLDQNEAESATLNPLPLQPDEPQIQPEPEPNPELVIASETQNITVNTSVENDKKEPSPGESDEVTFTEENPNPRSVGQNAQASWLPPTWTIEMKKRKKGWSKGQVDKYYISPEGHRCRSKTEVLLYCEHGPSKWRNAKRRMLKMKARGLQT